MDFGFYVTRHEDKYYLNSTITKNHFAQQRSEKGVLNLSERTLSRQDSSTERDT